MVLGRNPSEAPPIGGPKFAFGLTTPERGVCPPGGARPTRGGSEAAFSLVEVMIVVVIIGILAALAMPEFASARKLAVEQAVASNLKTMFTNQQLFYSNPVPLAPSSTTDLGPRFARLHELNSFSDEVFGTTVGFILIDTPRVIYFMVPWWPSNDVLRGEFKIQAIQKNDPMGFIYEVDESGDVVKIR